MIIHAHTYTYSSRPCPCPRGHSGAEQVCIDAPQPRHPGHLHFNLYIHTHILLPPYTHTPIHPYTYTLIHSCTHTFTHWPTGVFMHPYLHTPYSHTLIHSKFILPYTHTPHNLSLIQYIHVHVSPIPRSQGWACGPSAFIYQRIILLDYFSRKFYDYVIFSKIIKCFLR